MKKTISLNMKTRKSQSEILEKHSFPFQIKNSKVRSIIPVRFLLFLFLILMPVFSVINLSCRKQQSGKNATYSFQIPNDYLREAADIPSFWLSTYNEVNNFLNKTVHKGQIQVIGTSAGGRQSGQSFMETHVRERVRPHSRAHWVSEMFGLTGGAIIIRQCT